MTSSVPVQAAVDYANMWVYWSLAVVATKYVQYLKFAIDHESTAKRDR